MKFFHTVVFTASLLVLVSISARSETVEERKRTEVNNNRRIKRQYVKEDRWVWGYVDIVTYDEIPTAPSIEDRGTIDNNPCNLDKEPEMPDFSAPGRRISEQKCYVYMWDIKRREEIKAQFKTCLQYVGKNPSPTNPYFVIGGHDVESGEFPHMGAIGWKSPEGSWVFKCSGSLISRKFILTAAHCTRTSDRDTSVADPVPKMIRLGETDIQVEIDLETQFRIPYDENIMNMIVHPQYVSPKKYYDIALMELENNVIFSSDILPACLWPFFDTSYLGTSANVTGWGIINTSDRETSSKLKVAEVDIIEPRTCDELLRAKCNRLWCGIEETQICAGKLEGGVDSCWGDSGGPLQVKINLPPSAEGVMHFVIGVTSFGFGCALENTPGVYTRVSTFVDWIESVVWK